MLVDRVKEGSEEIQSERDRRKEGEREGERVR